MRARLVVLILAIFAVAAFAALNWSEFLRTTPLSFGAVVTEAPFGLILLGVITALLLAFVVASATHQTEHLMESRSHSKALQAQRELAEKAEASRFTDLRQHLDASLRENRQREAIAAAEFEKAMVQSQRELRNQLEQMNRLVAARLSEIETRIDARLDQRARPHVTPTIPV